MSTVALLGNPNAGKTSLFNVLTGLRQHVGNWPGVTVERKEGVFFDHGKEVRVVDLPGTYTLGARSEDERVARDFILKEGPETVAVICDALNLERGVYLLLQLLELRSNAIFVVNAMDEARKNGLQIRRDELEQRLQVPVVFTSVPLGEGMEELRVQIVQQLSGSAGPSRAFKLVYPPEVEETIAKMESLLTEEERFRSFNLRWLAVKFLEGDEGVRSLLGKDFFQVEDTRVSLKIVQTRYEWISSLIAQVLPGERKNLWTFNDALDHVLTHKFLGIPIFLTFLYMIFELTFEIAQPLSDLLDLLFSHASEAVMASGLPWWIRSLLGEGILSGVGGVLVFLPNLLVLFFLLGVLEESGYFPRAAFVVDRLMVRLKLSGRSFMSMILGFGCSVPAIMSARGIENRRERLVTVLSIPFISCSARLPVYAIFSAAFFGAAAGKALFLLYLISIGLTAVVAVALNRVLFKGQSSPLIMEMPRYRRPFLRNLLIYTGSKAKHFLVKAATIIFLASIVIWFLASFPVGVDVDQSFAATLGKWIEPVMRPLGFDWRASTALLFGLSAKEVVVSSMAMLYGTGEGEGLLQVLRQAFTPLQAFSFLIFVMAYVPCFATLGAIKSETRSWRWPIFSAFLSLLVAYALSGLVMLFGRVFV
ncbi:MAG TPA: ferrous iron transport protein B [Thermotogota bacterium]|nr:ferrous iron transport protein B [Thermotogota bacterium]